MDQELDRRSSEPPDDDRLAAAFLARWIADREQGIARPLADYLQLFPGHDALLAREWLHAASTPVAPQSAAPVTAEDADAAQRIGPWRLRRELGRGAQGVVYLAEDTRLPRTVALKVLDQGPTALGSAPALRWQREVEAIARLDHPGIATVYEVGSDSGQPWIAMRHVPGGSVQEQLGRAVAAGTGPPSRRDAIATAVQLCERAARALAAAHAAGIVHRDVKPANLLLAAPDQPVLVDFGLARDEQGTTPTITLPGAVLGTLCYLPPERLSGGAADARGDVYGLGCVLFELLTLRRPFQQPTLAAELHAIARDPLPSLREHNPFVDGDLALVVATALARDPAQRYQTAQAFADDLLCVLDHRPIAARPVPIHQRLLRFCQREPRLAASLGLVLVTLLLGGAASTWLWLGERKALADVTRLADLKLVRDLHGRAAALWPALPAQLPALQELLAASDALLSRAPLHAAALEQLPPPGTDPTVDWQREQLEALQQELAALAEQRRMVGARLEFASTVAARSLEQARDAWLAAAARVRGSTHYPGLELAPQLGLVPLGADPDSGLEEFAHLASGAAPPRDPATGKLRLDEASGIVLVLVPGGDAVLGAEAAAPDDGRPVNVDATAKPELGPCYQVRLEPFLLGKFEVTQAQWQRHTGNNPSTYQPGGQQLTAIHSLLHPVELVSWLRCEQFARELDLQLPTEAQWEWAYRALTRTRFPTGDEPRSLAGHENLSDRTAMERGRSDRLRFLDWLDDGHMVHAPVGSYRANRFGLHDMGGNVREWCADSWEDYPAVRPRPGDGLRRGEFDRYRIVRGGSFASTELDARAAARLGVEKTLEGVEAGLRVARRLDR